MINLSRGFAFGLLFLAASSGRGSAGALTPAPQFLAFPDTGTGASSATRTVLFTNTSLAAVTVDTITVGGNDAGAYLTSSVTPLPVLLPPQSSASVDVAFAPLKEGATTATLTATVRGAGAVDVPLTGTGVGPRASVNPSPIQMGGLPFGQPVAPMSVTVQNAGGGVLNVTGVSITGPDAASFRVSSLPVLPQAMSAGVKFPCTITFVPSVAGTARATLVVTSDDPHGQAFSTPLVGLAGDPQIALSVGTIIFGNERVNQSTLPAEVVITNVGLSDLHLLALSVAGPNAGDIVLVDNPSPATLPVGGSAKFHLGFSPKGEGPRSASIQISTDDPQTPIKSLALVGSGTNALLSIAPGALDFGLVRVNDKRTIQVKLTNVGSGPALVSKMQVMAGNDGGLFSSTLALPFVVPPMTTILLPITFAPLATKAIMGASIVLTTDDTKLGAVTLAVAAEGIAPLFSFVPMAMNFGNVAVGQVSAPMPLAISNAGDAPLVISTFEVAGINADVFTILPPPTLPITIAVGDTQTWAVTYAPAAANGDVAQINFVADDPLRTMASIPLSGNGEQANFAVTPGDGMGLDFGVVRLGHSLAKTVLVSNSGGAPLILKVTRAGMANVLADDAGLQLTVAPFKSATVNVTFTPVAMGPALSTFTLTPTDPTLMPATLSFQGVGEATLISTVPASAIDFGTIAVGVVSDSRELRIHNGATRSQILGDITTDNPLFVVDTSTLNKTLGPGGTGIVSVTCQPTAAGPIKGNLIVNLVGETNPVAKLSLNCNAIVVADGGVIDIPRPMGCAVGRGPRSSDPGVLLALLALVAIALQRRRSRG